MFYGLNGPPEIDAVLMSSNSRKKGKNVSVLSVCIRLLWNLCERACMSVCVCGCSCVCAFQMGLSEGFTHANEAT